MFSLTIVCKDNWGKGSLAIKVGKKYVVKKTLQNTVAIKVTKRIYQIQLQKGRGPLQMAEKAQQ